MGHEFTQLTIDNYSFLQTFLDVTKANLFFSKGLIFVEGLSEQVFLPSLAKLLKKTGVITKDLTQAGVSIINVQSTAFLEYVKIFQRNNNTAIPIPIAIITDSDVQYYETDKNTNEIKKKTDTEIEKALSQQKEKLSEKYNNDKNIHLSIAEEWTFEYALYRSTVFGKLFEETVRTVHPKITSDSSSFEKALAKKLLSHSLEKTNIAYKLTNACDKLQCTKAELENDTSINYLIEAVKHVCK